MVSIIIIRISNPELYSMWKNSADSVCLLQLKKLERDTGATATRGSLRSMNALGASDLKEGGSLTKMQAKSLLHPNSTHQANQGDRATFRLARIGPGWVVGTVEAVTGMQREGDTVAVTHCLLHHLPFSKIKAAEKTDPALVLHLYKLLSYLMAKRQEATIGQLATLHSIMASPAICR